MCVFWVIILVDCVWIIVNVLIVVCVLVHVIGFGEELLVYVNVIGFIIIVGVFVVVVVINVVGFYCVGSTCGFG